MIKFDTDLKVHRQHTGGLSLVTHWKIVLAEGDCPKELETVRQRLIKFIEEQEKEFNKKKDEDIWWVK